MARVWKFIYLFILLAGHVSSTKVPWETMLSNPSAPTRPLWPLLLRAYMCLCVCRPCDQSLRVAEPDVTMLAEALRLFCPPLPSVAQIQKSDVILFSFVDTRSKFKSSPADKNNHESIHRMCCQYYHILSDDCSLDRCPSVPSRDLQSIF